MKTHAVSLGRRCLLIAGAAAAAAPGALLANPCVLLPGATARPTVSELSTRMAGGKLIVSGRVFGADCKPLEGALVELWSAEAEPAAGAGADKGDSAENVHGASAGDGKGASAGNVKGASAGIVKGASAFTDPDGRFTITTDVPVRGGVHIRVSFRGQTLVTRREL